MSLNKIFLNDVHFPLLLQRNFSQSSFNDLAPNNYLSSNLKRPTEKIFKKNGQKILRERNFLKFYLELSGKYNFLKCIGPKLNKRS